MSSIDSQVALNGGKAFEYIRSLILNYCDIYQGFLQVECLM